MGIEKLQMMDLDGLRELASNETMNEWFDEVFEPTVADIAFDLAGLDALPGAPDEDFAEAVREHYANAEIVAEATLEALAQTASNLVIPELDRRAAEHGTDNRGREQFEVIMGLIATYMVDTLPLFATFVAALTEPLTDYPERFLDEETE